MKTYQSLTEQTKYRVGGIHYHPSLGYHVVTGISWNQQIESYSSSNIRIYISTKNPAYVVHSPRCKATSKELAFTTKDFIDPNDFPEFFI
jgi:hypothetical protein